MVARAWSGVGLVRDRETVLDATSGPVASAHGPCALAEHDGLVGMGLSRLAGPTDRGVRVLSWWDDLAEWPSVYGTLAVPVRPEFDVILARRLGVLSR